MSPQPRKRKKKEEEQLTADSEQVTEEAKDEAAEEKPKPKRRRRKKEDQPTADSAQPTEEPTADSGQPTEDAEEAKQDAATEEAEAEQAEAEGEPEPEDEEGKPKGSRGAEATAGRRQRPRRTPGETVTVRAKARYVRCAPRKARLVVDHIRGKSAEEARAILTHTPRAASRDVLKLLDSAIANAENNHELGADELRIAKVFVDEGPTLKRYRPRALGRATRIRKRTSHMTIHLTNQDAA
jgi:ribosomal protein L22